MSGTGLLPTEEAIARANALSKMPRMPNNGGGLIPPKNVRNAFSLNPKSSRVDPITANAQDPIRSQLMGLPASPMYGPVKLGGTRRRSAKQRKARKTRRKTRRSRA